MTAARHRTTGNGNDNGNCDSPPGIRYKKSDEDEEEFVKPTYGTPTRRRWKRVDDAGLSSRNKFFLSFFVIIVILWFGASISFIVILDREMINIAKPNITVPVRDFRHKLPKYPVDHRRLEGSSQRPLSDQAVAQCHRALWHTLETTAYVLPNNESFVITGDIRDLWLRDSAAQIHPLLLPNIYNGKSLVQVDPRLERVVSGLILKTARFIRFDPYANAFKMHNHTNFSKMERDVLGRHGYISTWNYELDSACYFMRMLYFFHQNFPFHPILRMREVKEAVKIMVDLWIAEQRHEEDAYPEGELFDCKHCKKPYRYNPKELKRNGKGTKTAPGVGLTWSGFRPSDDPCEYGYLIPANMFAVVVLGYMEELAETVWIDEPFMKKARQLKEEIEEGIKKHGIINHKKYGRIYAYEVDGLNNTLLMDDANVPSLLSMPYLGYKYDEEVWANTKRFLFSKDNPWYHEGKSGGVEYKGIGSPHTKFIPSSIWPMAMIMEGLIANNSTTKVKLVDKLLSSSAGLGWMHESFNPNNPNKYSRDWFCWPDSLFAELVMSLTSECPKPEHGRYVIKDWQDESQNITGSAFLKPGLEQSTLAVLSACIPGKRFNAEYINASITNKNSFCKKWGAECVISQEKHDPNITYSPKWEKLYLINKTLHESNADWLMWMDCDAAFSNLEIDWRKHLNGALDDEKVLLTSKDKNGINLGVLFVPNTSAAKKFILRMWEKRHWIEAHPNKRELKDQAALTELQKEDPILNLLVDGGLPQGNINSFIDNKDGHMWKPREWIAHQVWCQKAEQCTAHFLSILKEVATKGVATTVLKPIPQTPRRTTVKAQTVIKGAHAQVSVSQNLAPRPKIGKGDEWRKELDEMRKKAGLKGNESRANGGGQFDKKGSRHDGKSKGKHQPDDDKKVDKVSRREAMKEGEIAKGKESISQMKKSRLSSEEVRSVKSKFPEFAKITSRKG